MLVFFVHIKWALWQPQPEINLWQWIETHLIMETCVLWIIITTWITMLIDLKGNKPNWAAKILQGPMTKGWHNRGKYDHGKGSLFYNLVLVTVII